MANIDNLKPFVKGDPRINRKGRPKSFDKLRELAQSLADEQATTANGQPIVIDGHIATQAEMILRTLMKDNPERFLEIGYGKVPLPIEMSGDMDMRVEITYADGQNHTAEASPSPAADQTGA